MNDQLPAVATQSDAGALMQIIQRAATDKTFDVAKLEKLLEVRERWEAAEARKAFVAALNAFKASPPTVSKNKQVRFTTDRGTTEYRHATLDNVCEAIGEALSKHGLSHRWEVTQDKDAIRVACVLTHVLGHSERVSLEAMPDKSGSKNGIQAVGSTVTYLQRYTLLSVTGMATTDQDDDGQGHRREVLEAIARAMIEKFDANNEWGAYEEWKTVTDSEEMLKVWSILKPHSKLRAAMKRLDADAQRAEAEQK